MPNKLNLSNYAENNLRTLAAYLIRGELSARFNMQLMHDTAQEYKFYSHTCGSVGCAVGHGPYAGIPKHIWESWTDYMHRVFSVHEDSKAYTWLFSCIWSEVDDTPEGAGKRIRYMLENGVPDDASEYLYAGKELPY